MNPSSFSGNVRVQEFEAPVTGENLRPEHLEAGHTWTYGDVHRWNRNPRPQPRTFSKLVFPI